MFTRNESRTGEFYEVETRGNHDTTIADDLMFEFMMDRLDMQNTVFAAVVPNLFDYEDTFVLLSTVY
jgi:hypothetical protein